MKSENCPKCKTEMKLRLDGKFLKEYLCPECNYIKVVEKDDK